MEAKEVKEAKEEEKPKEEKFHKKIQDKLKALDKLLDEIKQLQQQSNIKVNIEDADEIIQSKARLQAIRSSLVSKYVNLLLLQQHISEIVDKIRLRFELEHPEYSTRKVDLLMRSEYSDLLSLNDRLKTSVKVVSAIIKDIDSNLKVLSRALTKLIGIQESTSIEDLPEVEE